VLIFPRQSACDYYKSLRRNSGTLVSDPPLTVASDQHTSLTQPQHG
jgi:hypothetical protein